MVIMSLFGGMECGRIALELMNIVPDKYYSSEIDKFAVKEVAANYPDIVQLGDITRWRDWDIEWWDIDLVIGGSPCQGFSFAGKQLAFDDPRSALFFVYIDVLNHVKTMKKIVYGTEPDFMLENVKMKKEYLSVITDYMGVDGVFINSALVSAQSRQRWYWANWKIEQPEDRELYLCDILEDEPLEFTLMSDKFVTRQRGRKCLVDDFSVKGSSLSAMEYVKNGRQGDYIRCGAMRGRYLVDGIRQDSKMLTAGLTTQRIEVRHDGKTNTLTTVQKDNLVTCGESYRKLTVIECCRLQGVPDNYFKVSSNTQCYKMLGNGWQVDTIKHILEGR